ncbi:MAG: PD-(D/E)XK nuclease family protein [Bryobacteraceae bacterium]
MAAVAAVSQGAAAAAPSSELATLLSPSQVACFTDCSAKWWFKYGLKMPDPKNANLALGIAVHESIGQYFRARMAGAAADLEPEDAAAAFEHAWARQLEGDTVLRDEDDPEEIRATGRILVSRYAAEIAPSIEPAAIEEPVEGVIAGVRVQGKVDIRETNGRLRDIKTASRKPCGVSAQHAFQLATYLQITPAAANVAVVDTLVKTKTPQLIQSFHRIDDQQIRATQRMYPLAQEAMRAGLYIPNRASNLCSRKSCAFWRSCEREFGGRVSE